MSRAPRTDALPHLQAVAAALPSRASPRRSGPRSTGRWAPSSATGSSPCSAIHPDSRESERCYTNQPAAYPVGGSKPFNESAWSRQLFGERRPYIGRSAEDIRAVFFDHALIASLGCDSVLNIPVAHDGRVLGTLNLLHEARWYDEADAAPGLLFAALAVPGYFALGQAPGG